MTTHSDTMKTNTLHNPQRYFTNQVMCIHSVAAVTWQWTTTMTPASLNHDHSRTFPSRQILEAVRIIGPPVTCNIHPRWYDDWWMYHYLFGGTVACSVACTALSKWILHMYHMHIHPGWTQHNSNSTAHHPSSQAKPQSCTIKDEMTTCILIPASVAHINPGWTHGSTALTPKPNAHPRLHHEHDPARMDTYINHVITSNKYHPSRKDMNVPS
jgi:hypothetical protein